MNRKYTSVFIKFANFIRESFRFNTSTQRLDSACRASVLCFLAFFAFSAASAFAQAGVAKDEVGGDAAATITAERFDDWTLRCVTAAATSPACEVTQPLMVSHDGEPVEILKLAVSRASDKAGKADWALVVLTPLDVHLPADFGFATGAAKPVLLKYRNCNQLGCFVIVPLENERLGAMKKASDGTAYFRLLNGQTVKVSFSLKGFTKAFDALATGKVPAVKAAGAAEATPPDAGRTGN
jgi:invasion protein IalB